jgi:hypothetical protein
MIPFLIIGIGLILFCFALIFILGKKDSLGLWSPNEHIAYVVIMMMLSMTCFIITKDKMYYNTKYTRIETLIKTKSIDGVVKSDTLIRIVKKEI